jgi:hypothetical protein
LRSNSLGYGLNDKSVGDDIDGYGGYTVGTLSDGKDVAFEEIRLLSFLDVFAGEDLFLSVCYGR